MVNMRKQAARAGERISRASLMMAAAWTVAGLTACGGSDTPPPEAGPQASTAQAKAEPSEAEQAAKLFDALSEELDKLAADATVDPAWLQQKLQAVVALDPNHVLARYNLAVLSERAGKKEDAVAQYQAIQRADPKFAPAAENLAAYHVDKGDVGKATAIYNEIIKADPTNITSRLGLARILSSQGKHQEAIELCRRVLQRQADAVEAFRILAQSYKATGNVPMAELIIGRGLKVDKDDPALHYLTAQILMERGDLAGAVGKLKEVIRMKPDWLKVRAELAAIALEYRDFGNASQQYEAIVNQKKNHRPAQIGLAVAYKGMGRFNEAEKIYSGLLQKNPKDPDALWNMASLYHHQLNKYDEAIQYYTAYKGAAPKGDKLAEQVPQLVAAVEKTKSDRKAEEERLARERKKQEAVQAVCANAAAGKPAGKAAEDIGSEEERIGAAWQLLTEASQHMAAGDVPTGEAVVSCAFAVLPDTPNAKVSACAPMQVMWTKDVLYPLGMLPQAMDSIDAALVCDPENPDAQLIKQQLAEIIAQQQAEQGGEGGEPAAAGAPGGAP